jgi:hypothetical protein
MRSKYERESRAQMAGLSPSFGRITGTLPRPGLRPVSNSLQDEYLGKGRVGDFATGAPAVYASCQD